ncbi:helix-turn-helix transcriptional regulator [Spirosoma rhododendri]|uniref:YafY family transcriptional regulator n=1 Tax=Spirosoma rhododendri TaxID=2728024 RepID=A0A7L5DH72_9BACT|nr:YafY family protein [Spirosoma rhododendri]QJD77599.1 YafY family transcriptional regulator [Spirosoma rhododendri]
MNRIDRLTAILIHLQSKRVVKAQELADRFGLSLRTIYRDIRALEEAGVPIGAEAGIGYFLTGYQLPPVMFSNAEASALLIGGKILAQMTDESIRTPYESALFKIKAVLSRTEKDHLDELAGQIEIIKPMQPRPYSEQLLYAIQGALVRGHRLTIDYRAGYSDTQTQRTIEPIGLCHYGVGWHLIAYCRLRHDYRDFRVDRIEQLTELTEPFSRQSRLSLQDYLNRLTQEQDLQEVVIVFSRDMARFAQDQRYEFGFVSEEETPDGVRMTFLTQCPKSLGRWLLMYGRSVCIESPSSMRSIMQHFIQDITGHYL